MDALCHEAVDLTGAVVGQHCHLHLHDVLVVTHHRACLRVFRGEGLDLTGGLRYQWKEQVEVDLLGFEYTLGQAISVVGEVACQNGGEVHLLPFLGVTINHMI